MKLDEVKQFLDDFTDWTSAQPEIIAAALVGSYARNAATDASDVNLVLIAYRPERYLQDRAWIYRFGEVRKQQVEDYELLISLRVWYTNGCETYCARAQMTLLNSPPSRRERRENIPQNSAFSAALR